MESVQPISLMLAAFAEDDACSEVDTAYSAVLYKLL